MAKQTDSGFHAESLLPEELWASILLDYLWKNRNDDLLNCSQVCQTFTEILKPSQNRWLFYKVICNR